MGNCCNKNKEVKVLFIGLDGSGKTSLLNVMKGESPEVETQPTVGFNFETVTHKDVDVNIWDTGGTEQIRELWKHYYDETDGICFVVDISDEGRLEEAKEALHKAVRDSNRRNSFLLIVCNKSEKADIKEDDVVAKKLHLDTLPGDPDLVPKVVFVSAKEKTNLDKLLDMLSHEA